MPRHFIGVLWILAAMGAAFLLYLPALQGQFVFDDIPLLVQNTCHHGLAGLRSTFDPAASDVCGLRPVRFASYAVDYGLFGPEPWGYHLTNHLLHGLVAALGGLLVLRLTGRRAVAVGAGVLFLVHPIATEAVAYIAGRRDLLAALFGLALAHLWLSARARPRLIHAVGLVGLQALALGSHESTVAFPAVLVAWEVFRGRSGPQQRRVWALLGGLLALSVAFALWTATARNFSRTTALWGGGLEAHVATVLHGHLHYLHQLAWPLALQADYSPAGFPIAGGLGEAGPLGGLAAVGLAVGLMVGLRRRAPLVALALATYGLLLLPSSQIVPHHELLAEHRLYLASLVFCGLVAAGVERGLGRWAFIPLVLLAFFYVALTRVRIDDWHDEDTLWTATLAVAPDTGRALGNLGALRAEQGRLAEAEELLQHAVAVRPDLCEAHYNLGLLWAGAGRAYQASSVDAFERAWACNPRPRWRQPIARRLFDACRVEAARQLDPTLPAANPQCSGG